jgi:FkbM family methyltransferase
MNLLRSVVKQIFRTCGIDIHRIPKNEKNENRLLWLQDLSIKTVLDIGANVGQFALEIGPCLPDAKIYSFEPLKGEYSRLVKNINRIANCDPFCVALGDFNGTAKLYKPVKPLFPDHSELSSLLQMNNSGKKAYSVDAILEEAVTVRRLDDFIFSQRLDLNPEILIKLDVQGYEDKVIAGGRDTFIKATVLIVELIFCELYKGQRLFDECYSKLKELGFKYKGNLTGSHLLTRSGLQVEVDAVFMKE